MIVSRPRSAQIRQKRLSATHSTTSASLGSGTLSLPNLHKIPVLPAAVDNDVYNCPLGFGPDLLGGAADSPIAKAGMDEAAQRQDGFSSAFESAFAALRTRIETACAGQPDWSSGVAEGVRAALAFAAADPPAARALTTDALAAGKPGFAKYERMIAYLRGLLVAGRDEHPDAERLPGEIERALAGGIAMLVAQRLDLGREDELPDLAAEAIQFVLTPYLGIEKAKRVAAPPTQDELA